MTLAIFDLDNTLLAGDSDHAWGEFLVERGIVEEDYYREANDRFFHAYQAGDLDIHEYLAFALEPLSRHPLETLLQWREDFFENFIRPLILPAGRELLAEHRSQGHHLMIITATNRFVTEPIAQALGVETLIATDPEFQHGRYTGAVAGTPSFREGKVVRLNQWLNQNQETLADAWFYSDSHNDLPLLEAVPHPIAVDPDPTLEAAARERRWPIMSLRHAS
ncbi:HAD family hydrolase [Marinobacteraceae bacterium S3BR75-40.1]